jgi:hypothetical protein
MRVVLLVELLYCSEGKAPVRFVFPFSDERDVDIDVEPVRVPALRLNVLRQGPIDAVEVVLNEFIRCEVDAFILQPPEVELIVD